jgi:hypothetical protein
MPGPRSQVAIGDGDKVVYAAGVVERRGETGKRDVGESAEGGAYNHAQLG